MSALLLGNLLSMLGCTLMVAGGFIKKKSRILFVQSFQFALQSSANLILGAINGFVCGIVGIVRNIVFSRVKSSVPLKLFFIVLQFALSVGALKNGAIEWLPIISGALFTWFLDTKNEATLKKAIIVSQLMWLVYDASFKNYVGACFDFMTMCSNLIGIYMLNRDRKKESAACEE